MEAQFLYLAIAFCTIILLLALHRPLYQSILGGLLVTAVLYRIPLVQWLLLTLRVFTDWSSCSVLVSLYLITYLQRALEARNQIKLAQQDLNGLFHNRRVNATGAPLFIGLLPSAAAMILCGDIVKDATEGYLDRKEQAFVTSWLRHVPESILPTYSGVLLMTSLSQVPISKFMLGMLPPTVILVLLGYIPYIRRLPKDPGTEKSTDRRKDALHLVQHLWSFLLILTLILLFDMQVVTSMLVTIAAVAVVYRFKAGDLVRMARSAFEMRLLVNTFLVLVLKEFIGNTGVLEDLPTALSALPIPMYLIFALLFFVGGIISGAGGIIALGTPLAFAALPDGGMPLMVLLMCMSHAASQISPTHVCLVVAAEYYDVTMGDLIKKSIPYSLLFVVISIGYYLLSVHLF